MEKVLFVTKYPFDTEYSIKKKFDGQMGAVTNLGYDVYHTAYDGTYTYLVHNGERMPVKKIALSGMPGYIHTKAFLDMYDTVLRVIKKERFDYAYIRFCELTFLGYRMIKMLREAGTKVIVEIPTYPIESEKISSFFRRMCRKYINFWWSKAERYCTLFTLIGEKADSYHGIPAINIDNGIFIDEIPMREDASESDEPYHVLIVASMSYWQGYDRLIEGLAAAPAAVRDRIVVDFVGGGGDGSRELWRTLAQEKGVADRLRFHGYLVGDELKKMFDIASIGVGSLGLYRSNIFCASTLKLREYTARGLPFAYAGEDPALDGDEPFALRLPNDDTPIDAEALLSFIRKTKENKNLSHEMREYAKKRMSWERQFEVIFDLVSKMGRE